MRLNFVALYVPLTKKFNGNFYPNCSTNFIENIILQIVLISLINSHAWMQVCMHMPKP